MASKKNLHQLKKSDELLEAVKKAKEVLSNSPIDFSDPGTLRAFLSRIDVIYREYGTFIK